MKIRRREDAGTLVTSTGRITAAAVLTVLMSPVATLHAELTEPGGGNEVSALREAIWDSTDIPVCWENADEDNEDGRDWTRAAVARTWESESPLRFTGWGNCADGASGIRIRVSDTGPHVKALGSDLDGRVNGMVLNFTYRNWGPSCRSTLQRCTEVIAVHEFGHAIAMAHEQNRSDAPSKCRADERQGTDGDWLVTPYDLQSVMNYCNPSWSGNGQLSASDIHGLVTMYGSHPNNVLGRLEDGDRFAEAMAAGDFDGDGIPDLAVGAPGEAIGSARGSGAVYVYRGTRPGGLRPWKSLTQSGLGNDEAGDRFGHALAAGDFDGDGRDDLAVGAPGEAPGSSPESGHVFLFKGSASGLQGWRGLGQGGLASEGDGDRFGHALVTGDLDGDGRQDLVVGAPGKASVSGARSGQVYTYRSVPGALSPWQEIGQEDMGSDETGDLFGHALTSGDYDGDGKDDLVVGAPGEAPGSNPKSGLVFTFKGSASGATPWRSLGQAGLGTDERDDRFGWALASGDIDDDGRADLVVGAPGESPGSAPKSGYAFLFRGTATDLVPWKGFGQNGAGTDEEDDRFAETLAMGDFNDDGKADLAIGAPGEAPGSAPRSGFVFLFAGSASGPSKPTGFGQAGLGADEQFDEFARALVFGDFDDDGKDDLVAGTPNEAPHTSPRSGFAFVFGERDVSRTEVAMRPWYAFGQAY